MSQRLTKLGRKLWGKRSGGGRSAGLSYEWSGEGEPVLLIHGNLAGKSWWREVMAEPTPGYRYVAPDLPGFGESGKGSEFRPSIRGYARSLLLLDYAGIGRVSLVGHSLGGAVAMELVSEAPDRFSALMLVDSVSPAGLHTPLYYYPYLRSLKGDRESLHRALQGAMSTRTPPYFEELVDEAARMHPASFSGNARALDDWRAGENLQWYGGPVKVMAGERDSLTSPMIASETAATFRSAGPVSIVHVPGAGHSPQIEAPRSFRSELSSLLAESA